MNPLSIFGFLCQVAVDVELYKLDNTLENVLCKVWKIPFSQWPSDLAVVRQPSIMDSYNRILAAISPVPVMELLPSCGSTWRWSV